MTRYQRDLPRLDTPKVWTSLVLVEQSLLVPERRVESVSGGGQNILTAKMTRAMNMCRTAFSMTGRPIKGAA